MDKIFEILCSVAFFQLLLFSVFLLTRKTGNRVSNSLLGIFFMAKGLGVADVLVRYNGDVIYSNVPTLFFLLGGFDFLFGPLLYLYVRSVTDRNFILRLRYLAHLIPFALYYILLYFQYYRYSPEIQRQIISSGFTGSPFFIHGIWSFYHFLVLLYLLVILRILNQYNRELKKEFSNSRYAALNWLTIVIYGFIAMWMFYLINHLLYSLGAGDIQLLYLAGKIMLIGFSTFVIFKTLSDPEIIPGINVQKNTYTVNVDVGDISRIEGYMKKEKPYLDPELAIHELAERISMPKRKLSYILNNEFNKNFFEFVNEYRVNEVITCLRDPDFSDKTILEILYQSGFNSKSVFNTIFKKQTGCTPTQYKQQFLLK